VKNMATMMTKLTPARIAEIKESAKGKLPSFLSGGVYNQDGVKSVGVRVGKYGAAVGVDKGKPFGSVNKGGRIKASFGPQGK
jgi:hypothetical protein